MKWIKRRRLNSIVGLSFAGNQLHLVHVARARNAIAVLKSTTVPLSLDLLHPEPALVAREIQNHLEAAGIRERHCIVALPPAWIMSHHTAIPDLSAEDLADLLQIEAEKSFPVDPEALQIARSPQRAGEKNFVTQLAVRHERLLQLLTVLRHAGLKPVSLSLGLAALADAIPAAGTGRITLVLEPSGAVLMVAAGGGIAALRVLEASIESEAGETVVHAAALARELRITFEQVPPDLRREIRTLSVRGDERMVQNLPEPLRRWAEEAGLTVEIVRGSGRAAGTEIIERLAEQQLQRGAPVLEFLPPRPSRWATLMARYNSKRLATAGFAAAAAVIVLLAAFGWQEYRRWSLRTQWNAMAAQVGELEGVQARIREFRPWYDASFRNLTILRRVVECFPENGTVTAKTFEIRSPATVSVSGTARDNAALLRTLDQLRQAKEVQGLKIEQIRGKSPAQFTFTFRWIGTAGI